MNKFKVKVEYEVAEIIDTPDNEKRMGIYPDSETAIVNTSASIIATSIMLSALVEMYSDRGKYLRIKNTYAQPYTGDDE